jgi:D-sedoheptulose 7-phosphate isomerase
VLNDLVQRDGRAVSPRRLAEFRVSSGVEAALARLRQAGFLLLVVTNQPDIARGLLEASELEAMHRELERRLPLDRILFCPHEDGDRCRCRKPLPGMLLQLQEEYGLDPALCWLLGDAERDILAGRAYGCRTILLDRSYNDGVEADFHATSIEQAAALICADARVPGELRMDYVAGFIQETQEILQRIDQDAVRSLAMHLARLRERGGRLFCLGVGGGAGHASHAVNDFRKICGIESYAPSDNVSELTARINDDGWEHCYRDWLRGSRLAASDALLIFSVGGGDEAAGVSLNLVSAMKEAQRVGAEIYGIVGRDGGYTAAAAAACVVLPPGDPANVTTQTEGLQSVLWHLLVGHPELRRNEMKWESVQGAAAATP